MRITLCTFEIGIFTMRIIIKTMDAQMLYQMHAKSFAQGWSLESFQKLLQSQGVEARMMNEVGFLLTRSVADEMEVLTIAVLPSARRSSAATMLMQDALKQAVQMGIQCCFLEVDEHNIAAIRCYEKLGFSVISKRKNYYISQEGNSDALVMRYML
jgi:ribosomal-protein-alanine N-acetyltransferase